MAKKVGFFTRGFVDIISLVLVVVTLLTLVTVTVVVNNKDTNLNIQNKAAACADECITNADCGTNATCVKNASGCPVCKAKPTTAPVPKPTPYCSSFNNQDCSCGCTKTLDGGTCTKCPVVPATKPVTPKPASSILFTTNNCNNTCKSTETCVSLNYGGYYGCQVTTTITTVIGQTQCNGQNQQTWNGSSWNTISCTNGCSNNKCNPPPSSCSNAGASCLDPHYCCSGSGLSCNDQNICVALAPTPIPTPTGSGYDLNTVINTLALANTAGFNCTLPENVGKCPAGVTISGYYLSNGKYYAIGGTGNNPANYSAFSQAAEINCKAGGGTWQPTGGCTKTMATNVKTDANGNTVTTYITVFYDASTGTSGWKAIPSSTPISSQTITKTTTVIKPPIETLGIGSFAQVTTTTYEYINGVIGKVIDINTIGVVPTTTTTIEKMQDGSNVTHTTTTYRNVSDKSVVSIVTTTSVFTQTTQGLVRTDTIVTKDASGKIISTVTQTSALPCTTCHTTPTEHSLFSEPTTSFTTTSIKKSIGETCNVNSECELGSCEIVNINAIHTKQCTFPQQSQESKTRDALIGITTVGAIALAAIPIAIGMTTVAAVGAPVAGLMLLNSVATLTPIISAITIGSAAIGIHDCTVNGANSKPCQDAVGLLFAIQTQDPSALGNMLSQTKNLLYPVKAVSNLPDYYETLGVSKDATPAEIKRAFLDLNNSTNNWSVGISMEDSQKIVKAWQILSNPETRVVYDLAFNAQVSTGTVPITPGSTAPETNVTTPTEVGNNSLEIQLLPKTNIPVPEPVYPPITLLDPAQVLPLPETSLPIPSDIIPASEPLAQFVSPTAPLPDLAFQLSGANTQITLTPQAKADIIQQVANQLPNDGASPQLILDKLAASGIPESQITANDIEAVNALATNKTNPAVDFVNTNIVQPISEAITGLETSLGIPTAPAPEPVVNVGDFKTVSASPSEIIIYRGQIIDPNTSQILPGGLRNSMFTLDTLQSKPVSELMQDALNNGLYGNGNYKYNVMQTIERIKQLESAGFSNEQIAAYVLQSADGNVISPFVSTSTNPMNAKNFGTNASVVIIKVPISQTRSMNQLTAPIYKYLGQTGLNYEDEILILGPVKDEWIQAIVPENQFDTLIKNPNNSSVEISNSLLNQKIPTPLESPTGLPAVVEVITNPTNIGDVLSLNIPALAEKIIANEISTALTKSTTIPDLLNTATNALDTAIVEPIGEATGILPKTFNEKQIEAINKAATDIGQKDLSLDEGSTNVRYQNGAALISYKPTENIQIALESVPDPLGILKAIDNAPTAEDALQTLKQILSENGITIVYNPYDPQYENLVFSDSFKGDVNAIGVNKGIAVVTGTNLAMSDSGEGLFMFTANGNEGNVKKYIFLHPDFGTRSINQQIRTIAHEAGHIVEETILPGIVDNLEGTAGILRPSTEYVSSLYGARASLSAAARGTPQNAIDAGLTGQLELNSTILGNPEGYLTTNVINQATILTPPTGLSIPELLQQLRINTNQALAGLQTWASQAVSNLEKLLDLGPITQYPLPSSPSPIQKLQEVFTELLDALFPPQIIPTNIVPGDILTMNIPRLAQRALARAFTNYIRRFLNPEVTQPPANIANNNRISLEQMIRDLENENPPLQLLNAHNEDAIDLYYKNEFLVPGGVDVSSDPTVTIDTTKSIPTITSLLSGQTNINDLPDSMLNPGILGLNLREMMLHSASFDQETSNIIFPQNGSLNMLDQYKALGTFRSNAGGYSTNLLKKVGTEPLTQIHSHPLGILDQQYLQARNIDISPEISRMYSNIPSTADFTILLEESVNNPTSAQSIIVVGPDMAILIARTPQSPPFIPKGSFGELINELDNIIPNTGDVLKDSIARTIAIVKKYNLAMYSVNLANDTPFTEWKRFYPQPSTNIVDNSTSMLFAPNENPASLVKAAGQLAGQVIGAVLSQAELSLGSVVGDILTMNIPVIIQRMTSNAITNYIRDEIGLLPGFRRFLNPEIIPPVTDAGAGIAPAETLPALLDPTIQELKTNNNIRTLLNAEKDTEAKDLIIKQLSENLPASIDQTNPVVQQDLENTARNIIDTHMIGGRVQSVEQEIANNKYTNFDNLVKNPELPNTPTQMQPSTHGHTELDSQGIPEPAKINFTPEEVKKISENSLAIANKLSVPTSGKIDDVAQIIGAINKSLADSTTVLGKDQRDLINILYSIDIYPKGNFPEILNKFVANGGEASQLPQLFSDLLSENLGRYKSFQTFWDPVFGAYNEKLLPEINSLLPQGARPIKPIDPESVYWISGTEENLSGKSCYAGFCGINSPINDSGRNYISVDVTLGLSDDIIQRQTFTVKYSWGEGTETLQTPKAGDIISTDKNRALHIFVHESIHSNTLHTLGIYEALPGDKVVTQTLEELTERTAIALEDQLVQKFPEIYGSATRFNAYPIERGVGTGLSNALGISNEEVVKFGLNQDPIGYIKYMDETYIKLNNSSYQDFVDTLYQNLKIGPAQKQYLLENRPPNILDIRQMVDNWVNSNSVLGYPINSFQQAINLQTQGFADYPEEALSSVDSLSKFLESSKNLIGKDGYIPTNYFSQSPEGQYILKFERPQLPSSTSTIQQHQNGIVAIINAGITVVDNIAERIATTISNTFAMTQTRLGKAFINGALIVVTLGNNMGPMAPTIHLNLAPTSVNNILIIEPPVAVSAIKAVSKAISKPEIVIPKTPVTQLEVAYPKSIGAGVNLRLTLDSTPKQDRAVAFLDQVFNDYNNLHPLPVGRNATLQEKTDFANYVRTKIGESDEFKYILDLSVRNYNGTTYNYNYYETDYITKWYGFFQENINTVQQAQCVEWQVLMRFIYPELNLANLGANNIDQASQVFTLAENEKLNAGQIPIKTRMAKDPNGAYMYYMSGDTVILHLNDLHDVQRGYTYVYGNHTGVILEKYVDENGNLYFLITEANSPKGDINGLPVTYIVDEAGFMELIGFEQTGFVIPKNQLGVVIPPQPLPENLRQAIYGK